MQKKTPYKSDSLADGSLELCPSELTVPKKKKRFFSVGGCVASVVLLSILLLAALPLISE